MGTNSPGDAHGSGPIFATYLLRRIMVTSSHIGLVADLMEVLQGGNGGMWDPGTMQSQEI